MAVRLVRNIGIQTLDLAINNFAVAVGPMSTSTSTPFSVRLLRNARTTSFQSLLPAATRNADDDIQVPSVTGGDLAFLGKDLLVDRLNDVHGSIWMAGRPMPPRHIGHQIVLSREVVATEDMGLHLVWKAKRIFIKPLPKYLLDEGFWKQHLLQNLQRPQNNAKKLRIVQGAFFCRIVPSCRMRATSIWLRLWDCCLKESNGSNGGRG
jgi:hypothetical protein